MRFIIISLLLLSVLADELLVTKDYVKELRKHVTWEVEDYESNIFKGWTVDDATNFLGLLDQEERDLSIPEHVPAASVPKEMSWRDSKCDHEVRNQGNCGSCWAFAAAGMLTDRCCIHSKDQGPLSAQELVSCEKSSYGCHGGFMGSPITYIQRHNGLVPESCDPYQAKDLTCPSKCVDGKDWQSSHICKCNNPQSCSSTNSMKSCLSSGPVTYSFRVYKSFFSYRSGIYHCDNSGSIGGHAVLAMGYGDEPECYLLTKNSWSTVWGDKGYFKMGCKTCGVSGGMMCSTVG